MSYYRHTCAAARRFSATPSEATPETYLEKVQAFATLFWRLNESSGGTFNEGVSGTLDFSADAGAQAELEYINATLAQDDSGGRCLGFKTHGGTGATVLTRATNAAFDVTAGGWWCLFQADDLNDKHTIVARDDGTGGTGRYDLGVMADGSLRSFRIAGDDTQVTIQSLTGLIVPGVENLIGVDWGDAGLRIWLNGEIVASEEIATPASGWGTATTAGIRAGRWRTGVTGADGVMGWLMFRNSQPTAQQVADLAATQGISLLTGADLGEIEDGAQAVFNIRNYGHFSETITSINETTSETNVDITISGDEFTVEGLNVVTNETFGLSVTDERGTTSAANFTIDVTTPAGGGSEHITTPEEWGWASGNSVEVNSDAMRAAIGDANDQAF